MPPLHTLTQRPIAATAFMTLCAWQTTLQAQEPPANPLSQSRPLVQRTIPEVIIEQAGFSGANCGLEEMQRNIPVRQLRVGRFVPPAQVGEPEADASQAPLQTALAEIGRQQLDELQSLTQAQAPAFSLCELRTMASGLTQRHQALTGQALSRVIIPAQDVTDGVLQLQVLEGRLEAFSLRRLQINEAGQTVTSEPDDELQQRGLAVLQALLGPHLNQPLNSKDLERALLLTGEITGQQVVGNLRSGQQSMGSILDVEARPERATQASLMVDNYGSPSIGRNQLSGSLANNALFKPGDRLSASYFTSEDRSSIRSYNLSYEAPVSLDGWRLGARTGRTQYAISGALASTQARGDAYSNALFVSHPLHRELNLRTDVSAGYSGVKLRDITQTTDNPRQAQVWWADLRGVTRDPLGSNSWGLGLTSGRLMFDSAVQQANDQLGLRQSGSYIVLNYDAKRQQILGFGFDAVASLRGQAANKNIDSYHKLGLGGVNGVRAFASGEVSGDTGYIARLELGYGFVQGAHRLAAFYDRGSVHINQTPLASNTTSNQVTLAGRGLQWDASLGSQWRMRLFVAQPVGGDRSTSVVDGRRTRLGLDLSYLF